MKHTSLITVVALSCFLGSAVTIKAQTTTLAPTTATTSATASPSAKPTTTIDKDVEALKENIATKVAELRKKGLKAVAGNITSKTGTQLEIKNSLGTSYTIKMDDTLTKVYQITGGTKKELKQDDLEKNMYVIVSGPLLDKAITANVIYVDEEIFVKSGKVTEVNTDTGTLKVATTERDNLTLDLPAGFRMTLLDKSLDTTIITLSKIKEGDTIHFVYSKTGKEKQVDTYEPLKILVIPQEFFQAPEPTETPTSAPSPKSSPSPTLKAATTSPAKASPSPTAKVSPTPVKR
jgi:hypothetical protein